MNFNRVILIGALGKDPDLKTGQGKMTICKFSLATTDKRKDKTEKTEWHSVTVFGSTAEIASKYLRKGSRCCIEGKITYGSYEKDGVKRYTTDIIADSVIFLDKKPLDQAIEKIEDNTAFGGTDFRPTVSSDENDIPF